MHIVSGSPSLEAGRPPMLRFKTDTAQYVRVLGAFTAGVAILYVVWIFVDSRHPAKTKLWKFDAKRLQAS